MNLVEGLHKEIMIANEQLKQYEAIPTGVLGAAIIKAKLNRAESALASGEVVDMLSSLEELREIAD